MEIAEQYCVVKIDSGGFIRGDGGVSRVIHRETRNIPENSWFRDACYDTLDKAKEKHTKEDNAILGIDSQGGAFEIWMYPEQKTLLTERLKVWSGCYGSWEVRKLNAKT